MYLLSFFSLFWGCFCCSFFVPFVSFVLFPGDLMTIFSAMFGFLSFICVCIFFFFNLFILFLAVLGLRCCARAFSSCSEWATLCCGAQASHRGGFSLLWSTSSRHLDFSSCGSQALLFHGMWDLPRPGPEPMSPALAGRFPATAPPEKPCVCIYYRFLVCGYHEVYT